MITAVDSSVLLDLFTNAPGYSEKAASAFRSQLSFGSLVACSLVWAEVGTFFPDPKDLTSKMKILGVDFLADTEETALAAAVAWKVYRKSGGKRERLIADFLIGAHAQVQCDCLLTRDRGFYRSYFKSLKVIDLN